MNRPTMLFQALLAQASMELDLSTERDFVTLRSRFEHEGLSFLTITLPRLSDALEQGIETGWFTLPLGFRRGKGSLPVFLQGFFNRVFNLDGSLLQTACGESIMWIRQITRFYKKPMLSCNDSRNRAAVRKFKEVEEDLYHATQAVNRRDPVLDVVSAILWSTIFPIVDHSSLICGHGPGVTADHRLSNERRRLTYWYTRAEGSFSVADHAFHNWGAAIGGEETHGGLKDIEFLDLRDEPGVRVVFVPKTLTTPRVIAIEPASMQFMQQGLSRFMVDTLERHDLTSGSVNFTDQTINQELAYSSSIDRSLATIDLSEASDRVHLELVQRIFKRSPILESLEDARSLHADLPDGTNILLKKYASMGSALCFPVEACVFYTLILSAILTATKQKPCFRSILQLKKRVKVYGDDLIVPVEHVDAVCDYLESYGLRVNRHKTFSKSAFRESCGADFYHGKSVKPVYARMDIPISKRDWTPTHLMSWVSTANQFYMNGMWIVAQAIREMVSSNVVMQIPISRHFDEGLCFASCFQERNLRFNSETYSWQQRRIVFTPIKIKDDINGDYTASFNLVFERTRNRESSNEDGRNFAPRQPSKRRIPSRSTPFWESESVGQRREPGGFRLAEDTKRSKLDPYCGRWLFRASPHFGCHYGDSGILDRVNAETGIDFQATVKRGAFKSKRRWVTITS